MLKAEIINLNTPPYRQTHFLSEKWRYYHDTVQESINKGLEWFESSFPHNGIVSSQVDLERDILIVFYNER